MKNFPHMLAYVGFFLYFCGQIYCVYTFAPMCTRCMLLKVRENGKYSLFNLIRHQ